MGPCLRSTVLVVHPRPRTQHIKLKRAAGQRACRLSPPQGTIQSSSRQWLVNQKMNKKWTRRKSSQELAALMWEGQEVGCQTPDSSKCKSNRCENNEGHSSEDRFVDKPNLLIIPDAEQEMLRISTRLGSERFLSAAEPWRKRTNDVTESSGGNKNVSAWSWEAWKVKC